MSRHTRSSSLLAILWLALAACDGDGRPDPSRLPSEPPALGHEDPTPEDPEVEAPAEPEPVVLTGLGQPLPPSLTPPGQIPPGVWEPPVDDGGAPLTPEATAELVAVNLEEIREAQSRIFRLGAGGTREGAVELAEMANANLPKVLRVDALSALGVQPWPELVPALRRAMRDRDVDIRAAAAIRLKRWGQRDVAVPMLKKLALDGVVVSQAFVSAYHKGLPIWEPEAAAFLRVALGSATPEVRVDAAVGLLLIDPATHASESLRVLKMHALEAERWTERVHAVSALTAVRQIPAIRTLLARASRDEEPRVASAARTILAMEEQP